MVTVGVIGYGYWGPNLVRNFAENPLTTVRAVSDLDSTRLALVSRRYPTISVTTDYRDLLADPAIDAIIVATPVQHHYALALEALRAGKHVLVEKPLASTFEQARHLVDEAEKRNLVLMVDHTFVYTGAVQKIRELVEQQTLGDIYYYDSVRVNLGLFQHDVNVIWDLAVHDLAIMDYVLDAKPCAVSATGISHVRGKPENTAYLTLFFPTNVIGHIHINWLAPVKIRRTLVGGSQRMIVYDDLEPSEKIKVYDKGITLEDKGSLTEYDLRVGYRSGDMWAPQLSIAEALGTEVEHFVACVQDGARPLSDGRSGMRIVQILEAATRSLKERGRPVELTESGVSN